MANFSSEGTMPTHTALSSRSEGTPLSGAPMISLRTLVDFTSCSDTFVALFAKPQDNARHANIKLVFLMLSPPPFLDLVYRSHPAKPEPQLRCRHLEPAPKLCNRSCRVGAGPGQTEMPFRSFRKCSSRCLVP